MWLSFDIAKRFFLESKRSMLLSAAGVVFGVSFFITGQAQTEGFQEFFIETILGSKGAVIIEDRFQSTFTDILANTPGMVVEVKNPQSRKYYPGISNAYRVIETLMDYPNVVACSPVLEGAVVLNTGFRTEVASMYGIDMDYHTKTTDLTYQIVEGSIEDFRNTRDGVLIGKEMADNLEIKTGQAVFLMGDGGQSRRFRVMGIYETGINAIDGKRIYVMRRAAQSLVNQGYDTSFILVKLADPSRAPQDAQAFEELLHHRARSWQHRERSNLQIFKTLRISAGLGISAIIMLAGFGIFNVLTMSVMEKIKEISILRSMGFTRGDIALIFLWQGILVAVVGIALGWGLGALMTYGVEFIPIRIRGIFKADHFIVSWQFRHYILAAILAIISVLIAAYIPARRAAKLEPVDVLRGSSQ